MTAWWVGRCAIPEETSCSCPATYFRIKQLFAAGRLLPSRGTACMGRCWVPPPCRRHRSLLGSLPQQPVLYAPVSCWANICSWTVWHVPPMRPFSPLHNNTFKILKCALFVAVNVQNSCFGLVCKVFGQHHCCIWRIKEVPTLPPTPQTV